MELDLIKQAITKIFPNGYFPKEMTPSEQEASMDVFSKSIYPIWMGIEEKDTAAESKLTIEELAAKKIMLEVLTVHKQDRAICDSGNKPSRYFAPPADSRKKQAASDKYSGWSATGV